jgi:hypothetical protein
MNRPIECFCNEILKYLWKANPSASFLMADSTWTAILSQTCAKSITVPAGCCFRSSDRSNRLNFSSNDAWENRLRETRKETGRYDQSYRCDPAPWTSCRLLTAIITVICKCKRQFSWARQFSAPSVLCGVDVIYCSLLLNPVSGYNLMALSVLQLSSYQICSTNCHLRSRTVFFSWNQLALCLFAIKLSGS